MAGFENDVGVMKNLNFDEVSPKPHLGIIDAAGKIPIGTGNSFPTPEILGGSITSPGGSLTIGYSSPNITIDVAGGGDAIEQITVDNSTAPGTNPVLPSGGNVTITGGQVVNSSLANVIQTHSLAANSFAIQIQRSAAVAASDTTKNGVSHFDSTDFSVGAGGFVELATTGAGKTITGDAGGALSPTANNWNILGRSGSKTSGSGSTLTVNSPPFSQVGGSGTSTLNSGEFVTATAARTLPATAGLLDGDLVIYYATTANVLTVTANTGQTIRIGNTVSASAGTAASTAIGDSLTLRFDATAVSWRAVSVVGNWVVT